MSSGAVVTPGQLSKDYLFAAKKNHKHIVEYIKTFVLPDKIQSQAEMTKVSPKFCSLEKTLPEIINNQRFFRVTKNHFNTTLQNKPSSNNI